MLPYIPANGDMLSIQGVNDDIYAVPADLSPGRLSLYETSNGSIDASNLDPAFKVQAHHVRPWQVGDAQAAGLTEPLDFYEDAWGIAADANGSAPVFYGIAGANLTFYQKYDTSMSLFLASAFMSVWRQRGERTSDDPPTYAEYPIKVRMYVDGIPVRHTMRELPNTIYYGDTAGGFDFTREKRLTRMFNLHHMKYPGGSSGKGHDQLTKGWHSFGLGVYIEANAGSEEIFPAGIVGTGAAEHPPITFDALGRVRVYVRSVSTLRLL